MAATTFSIGASTYLVICNYGNVRRYETKSRVYRVNPDSALLVVRRLSKIMDCIQINFISFYISFCLKLLFFMHELQSLFIHLNSGSWYVYFKSIFDNIAPLWCEWKLRTPKGCHLTCWSNMNQEPNIFELMPGCSIDCLFHGLFFYFYKGFEMH